MMEEDRFWEIIDSSRQRAKEQKRKKNEDFLEVHERTLAEALKNLSPAEIIAFDDRFWERHRRAYRWDLWAVAYWLEGGCSDDGFTDFRACLISLGQKDYEAALADPDSLADVVDRPDAPYTQAEGFQYIASKTYKAVTGEECWPDSPTPRPAYPQPIGERFDFDDEEEMRRRFPRIVTKFPDGMD